MRHIFGTLLLISCLALPTAARDIYVNNVIGNDTVDGSLPTSYGDTTGPVRTLAKALRLARPGDRIRVANTGEPYRESVTVQGGKNSGLHGDAPLIIEGNGAVLDGSQPIDDATWESIGEGVFRAPCYIKSHQVLFLNNEPAAWVKLDAQSSRRPKLEPGEYFLWDGYLYLCVASDKTPQDYDATCAGLTVGLTLYDIRNVIIRDLSIRGFAFDGVSAPDNVTAVRLENVNSSENGRSGFSVGGAAKITLDRCRAGYNHRAQVRTETLGEVVLADCDLNAEAAPAMISEGGKVEVKTVK